MSAARGRPNHQRRANCEAKRKNLQPPRRDAIRQRGEGNKEMLTAKRRLLKMIVLTPQSLESAVSKGFRDFVKPFHPSLEIPDKSEIRSELFRVYNEKRNELRSSLASADGVVLTCESWSHRAEDSFLTVGCHVVDKLGNLKSYLLDTAGLFEDEPAAVQKQLSAVVEAWALEGKVHCVVRAGLPQLKDVRAKWMDMPCFADTLNVVFKDLMNQNELSRVFRKCRDIVRFFKFDPEAEEKLREIQKKLDMNQEELNLSCGDRWPLWLDMLEGLILQHDVMAMVLAQKKRTNLTLDENETEKVKKIISALKPLKEAASMMKKEGFQSISVVLPLLTKIMDDLQEEVKKGNKVAEMLRSKCKKEFGDVNQSPMALMTFLDPRYKNHLGEQNKRKAINKLKKELTAPPAISCSAAELKALLDKYVDYTPTAKDSNPLAWWRNTGKTQFGKLSKLALKKLGIVSTAVPLERAFSSAGVQFCNLRSSIEPENLSMILFLNSNFPHVYPSPFN